MHNLSDEVLCDRWLENPYYQFFCGELSFCHQLPFDPSSLTHWRQRLGEKPLAALVQESLAVAHKTGALATRDLERVVVDTTVQPKPKFRCARRSWRDPAGASPAQVRDRRGGLSLAQVNKVHHVHTIARVAAMLGEDEDWLRDVAIEMDQEDGLIWVYGPGDESVMAFTDFGIETLTGLIEIYKADPDLLKRSTDPN
jgi:hypothetical protein